MVGRPYACFTCCYCRFQNFCWVQLGVPDRGGRIDRVIMVLPIFPWRAGRARND